MKLKIAQQNATKIYDALASVNGKAVSFTISTYSAVAAYAAAVENMLEQSQLLKAERGGVVAQIRPSGPSASAYKYAAKSTTIRLERGPKDWFLVGVSETTVYPRHTESVAVTISPAQRDTIARKALADYRVAEPAKVETAIVSHATHDTV